MDVSLYKHCSKCDKVYPKLKGFYPNKARYDGCSIYCRLCDTIKKKPRALKAQREAVVKLLGAMCIECGYRADIRALQIDHINGGGNAERKSHKSSNNYLKSISDNIALQKHQILCVNCNGIKMSVNSEWKTPAKLAMPDEILGDLRDLVISERKKRTSRKRKLNDEQVADILLRLGTESQTSLGKRFGVHQTVISAIKCRTFYKNPRQLSVEADLYKMCITCKKVYPRLGGFCKDVKRKDGVYMNCRTCHNALNARFSARADREKAVMLLGGKCVNCGYDKNIRALQIDHVNSNGHQDKRDINSFRAYYKKILANINSGEYQCLCANCNAIKRHTHGEWSSIFAPMPEEITAELRDLVLAAKAPNGGRFINGQPAHNTKISKEVAAVIRERLKTELGSTLAKEYGVSQSVISDIKHKKTA
jgi:hypothetical protein